MAWPALRPACRRRPAPSPAAQARQHPISRLQQLAGGPVTADDNAALLHPLLSPTGCLAGSGDALPQLARRRHEPPHGDEYCVTYLRMAAWLAVLYLVYAEQRLCAWLGLPKDGLQQITFLELFSDVSSIAMYGAVLGWFVGVTDPRRFAWLTTRRRWAAWATLVGTPPVYSAIRWVGLGRVRWREARGAHCAAAHVTWPAAPVLQRAPPLPFSRPDCHSDVDALKHDLAAVTSWGPAFVALWAAGARWPHTPRARAVGEPAGRPAPNLEA